MAEEPFIPVPHGFKFDGYYNRADAQHEARRYKFYKHKVSIKSISKEKAGTKHNVYYLIVSNKPVGNYVFTQNKDGSANRHKITNSKPKGLFGSGMRGR